jgi:hypothetical protein
MPTRRDNEEEQLARLEVLMEEHRAEARHVNGDHVTRRSRRRNNPRIF